MEPIPAEPIAGFGLTESPPEPPREVTPAIARRIWTEPSVRAWWLATLVLAVVAIGFAVDRLYARVQQARLINHGTATVGKIIRYDMKNAPGQLVDPNVDIVMEYKDSAGTRQQAMGQVHHPNVIAGLVPIHFDPADPSVWTDETAPPGWVDTLFGLIVILPIVLLVGLFAWWQTRRMRRVWVTAPAMVAVVSARKQTPVAPMSWVVRCSLRDGVDRRLFNVHVPRLFGAVRKGSELWVLVPKGGRPVAVGWFL